MSAKHRSHQPKWSICCTTCYCLQSKRKRTWGVLTPPPQSPTPQGCPESPSWIQVEVILVAGGLHAAAYHPIKSPPIVACCPILIWSPLQPPKFMWRFGFLFSVHCCILFVMCFDSFSTYTWLCVAMPFIDSWNILLLFLICLSENNYKHVLFEHNLR